MSPFPWITTAALAEMLQTPAQVRVVDCRFELAAPAWGLESYLKAHIPGALFADLNRDLSSPITETSGRHPLPDPVEFTGKLAAWGIDPAKHVVVYDTTGGGFADRLWWLLRAVGHERVQLLDGGFPKWRAEDRPVQSGGEAAEPVRVQYPARFDKGLYVTTPEVQAMRQDPAYLLVDARSDVRFQGLAEPIDRVAGHIPGAVNRPHASNLNADGTFLPLEQLRREFGELVGGRPLDHVVVYCGSGVTSIHHLVALQALGLAGARLYVGSWSEWIRDPARPIATGK